MVGGVVASSSPIRVHFTLGEPAQLHPNCDLLYIVIYLLFGRFLHNLYKT